MGLTRLLCCFLLFAALTGCAVAGLGDDDEGSGYPGTAGAGPAADGGAAWDAGDYAGGGGSGYAGSSAGGAGGMTGGTGGSEGGAGGLGGEGASDADIIRDYSTDIERVSATPDPTAYLDALYECLPLMGDIADTCAAESCDEVRACCVNEGDCCSEIESAGITLDLSPCDGEEPAACLSGEGWAVEAFGPRQNRVHGNGFYPGGDDSGDSGLRFEPLFDLQSQRLKVSGVFIPGDVQCGAGCLEGVGLGFTSQEEIPADATAEIALLYSRSLNQMRLVRGGTVTAQVDMTETEQRWTLELQPNGRVLAYADGDAANPALDSVFEPVSGARLMLFGRSQDPASPDGAHLSGLEVEMSLCDIPDRWSERGELTLKRLAGTRWQPEAATAPSAARDDAGKTLLAFEAGGNIYLATQEAEDPYSFVLYSESVTPILRSSDLEEAAALGHPSLVWNSGEWVVYFTVIQDGGGKQIASARAPSGGDFTVDGTLDLGSYTGSLDAPSVVRRDNASWFMAAVQNAQGRDALVFFSSYDGRNWVPITGGTDPAEVLTEACETDPGEFFCDGVEAPDLSIHNGSWQLYFTGRQGTRRTIGLLAADVLTEWGWRLVSETGPVLGPSGTGFDRLSVLDPAALEGTNAVDLFYAGSDGSRTVLGRAWRGATSNGRF
jgi:hypothetical protein